MKGNKFNIGLASTALVLTLAPATQAFPQWMKPHHDKSKNAPPQYNAYDSIPAYGGGYSYGGLGPQPTIVTSLVPTISSATTESSSAETSSSVLPSGE